MGEGVRAALNAILAPMGLDVEKLQASGRYAEDVY
jgi:sulfite reductase alpha subunit-like flavoprotein